MLSDQRLEAFQDSNMIQEKRLEDQQIIEDQKETAPGSNQGGDLRRLMLPIEIGKRTLQPFRGDT
jgi:hypothetical protein